ncbi:MAG: PIN domain-containing protein [Brasilonema octagenarum HA4186-MV1]|jgi:PIN domain nuclease of toxin-antitoxin system|uniref:Type II toxin-antitoxin system VapC family toxin n=2 Tax=Brasilonema TaxID=383614 RepID=A0A856MA30_9CYAN|nr:MULTISPECIES: type II toxin-antitoxin system VapC family toxin [Brasilonema]MBW4628566.1 PIN domain-containing protein [Brasilonema octagenarum HA4186-MV1]NMF65814.1 type II toxin-antitoxin system VapC family toxin [Brasilonema octagenarum UFV-OR1]QDL06879.1 type II toxin-antitoxin system VapC family toxin [Brasilonema sennae CENA114]QDL13243.1 type II toxin-antitoxin system VapC family toxin [Brasilonema octagenarum UFV-E1]
MRLLLDTHTFLWFFTGNTKISNQVRVLIENEDNEKLLSTASLWEMAIKQSTGKLSFHLPFEVFITQQLSLNDFNVLDINLNHLSVVATLPLYHRDPFDRLFISQSIVEKIPILSIDSAFDAYPIERLW